MVVKPCGVVSVHFIGRGLLWGRICHKKDEPNHHPHPNTTGRINIGHCANTPFYIDVLPLSMSLLAYAFTGIGETLTRSIFGSGAVIAFGKRVFLFLAIRSFSQDMLTDPLLKLLGKFVLIPVGALYALGLLDMVAARL